MVCKITHWVKLHTLCKITNCVKIYTLCVNLHTVCKIMWITHCVKVTKGSLLHCDWRDWLISAVLTEYAEKDIKYGEKRKPYRVDGIHVKSPSAPHIHSSEALPHECNVFILYKNDVKNGKSNKDKEVVGNWGRDGWI